MILKLVIPGTPPSLNSWTARGVPHKLRARREWMDKVAACLLAQGWPRKPRSGIPIVRTLIYFRRAGVRDRMNFVPKWTLDQVVRYGSLEGDSSRHIHEQMPDFDVDALNPRTVLMLEYPDREEARHVTPPTT